MAHKLRSSLAGYAAGYPADMSSRVALPFGDTPDGDAWCRRALDPSDETAQTNGIPDEVTLDVCVERYQSTMLIQPPRPVSTLSLFNYEIHLYANPIAPIDVFVTDTADPTGLINSATFTWVNPQIYAPAGTPLPNYTIYGADVPPAAGTAFSPGWSDKVRITTQAMLDRYNGFTQTYQQARLLYESLTVNQIASTLTDQGQIIAVQQQLNPQNVWQNYSNSVYTAGTPPTVATTTTTLMSQVYAANDFPSYGDALNMPRAQQWQSREGVYLPVHLDEKFKEFKNIETPIVPITYPRFGTTGSSTTGITAPFPGSTNGTSTIQAYANPPPTGSNPGINVPNVSQIWPCFDPIITSATVPASTFSNASPYSPLIPFNLLGSVPAGMMPMLANNIGSIFIYGVPPGTTFQCKFLMGVECPTFAGSAATTHQTRSPELDNKALMLMSHITLKYLLDAYPADFNLMGKLGAWLKSTVLPAIYKYGKAGLGGALEGLAEGGPMGALAGGLGGLARETGWFDEEVYFYFVFI